MSPTGLPPRPDPDTGEPRPPRAVDLGYPGGPARPRGEPPKPDPPPGRGRVLAWHRGTMGVGLLAGTVMAVLMAALFTVRTGGFGWTGWWWAWLFVLPPVLLYGWLGRTDNIAAGADWVGWGGRWVDVYELDRIEMRQAGGGMKEVIDCSDASGRRLSIDMPLVQTNQNVWDLVYNGLLHSAHTRDVVTNRRARERLQLPPHPVPTRPHDPGTEAAHPAAGAPAAGLPTMPDPDTGEPRPPRAPRLGHLGRYPIAATERLRPRPPDGRGPVLEWCTESTASVAATVLRAFAWRTLWPTLVAAAALVAIGIIPPEWVVGEWLVWAAIPAVALAVAVALWWRRRGQISAGANWLARRGDWVDTYSLVEIRMSTPVHGAGDDLRFVDADRRAVRVPASDLENNPRLWDLVYNGIRHSARAPDLVCDERTRQVLFLTPHVRPHPTDRAPVRRARRRRQPGHGLI